MQCCKKCPYACVERKLTCFRFPSWHNLFYGNVVVPVANATHVSFHSPWIGFRNVLVLVRRKANIVRNALVLVLEWKLTCVRFLSWCNVFDVNVVVPVGKLTHVSFHSPYNVVINSLVLVLEGKLTCVSFPSLCNVVVTNALILLLEGKLTCVRFPSWCNVFDDIVVVLVGKLTCASFHSLCKNC